MHCLHSLCEVFLMCDSEEPHLEQARTQKKRKGEGEDGGCQTGGVECFKIISDKKK